MRYAAIAAALVVALVVALVAGCNTMPTTISQEISVEKDADGKVLKIIEKETVIQRGANIEQLKMKHFKEAERKPDEDFLRRVNGDQANTR